MEDITDKEEEKKPTLTGAQRKAQQRERDKAKALGLYQQPALDRAKEVLSMHENPALEVITANQELMAGLMHDDIEKLKRYIVNLNYRRRIEKEKQNIREEVE